MEQASASSSTHELHENLCDICTCRSDEKLVHVGVKGKQKLKDVSIERGDHKFSKLDFSKPMYVHHSCRSHYTHPINVDAFKRNREEERNSSISPPKRKLRRSADFEDAKVSNGTGLFDWKKNCFICGEEAIAENEKKKRQELRRKINCIQSSDFVSSTVHKLSFLQDDFHREIYKRLCDARDVVSLQAKYHHDCFVKFVKQYTEVIKIPQNTYSSKIDQAMEEIFEFMLSSEECQFTITQLKEAVTLSDMIPSDNTIKQRLQIRFSNQIVFSSRMGGVTYVCFANNLYDILTDAWYNNRKQSVQEEEDRLIDSASELVRRKIRNTICRIDEYPASDKVFDNIDENIPPHLIRFLHNVIYKDKKKMTAIINGILEEFFRLLTPSCLLLGQINKNTIFKNYINNFYIFSTILQSLQRINLLGEDTVPSNNYFKSKYYYLFVSLLDYHLFLYIYIFLFLILEGKKLI